ncbi:MAG TPA: type II CAAX endopeptidase family protein [Terracidiphilus sp.]|jgi:membrane protease YdiL (CAAX protease family)
MHDSSELNEKQGSTNLGDARPEPVASYLHTLGLLGIFAAVIAVSYALQGHASPNSGPPESVRRNVIPLLFSSLAFGWGTLYFVWVGVHWKGGNLFCLTGRRWRSLRDLLRDLAIAAPFWVLWEATAFGVRSLLGPSQATRANDTMFPVRGIIEIPLWIIVSTTAGFCEELIFRGYLMRQLHALSGSIWLAVLGQGVFFGLMHPRGWKAMTVISVLGVLYGALAAWRNDLKPGMLAHAWGDMWEGWLKPIGVFPW